MAVITQNSNIGFEIAADKVEKFLKVSEQSNAFELLMERARRNNCNFITIRKKDSNKSER